MTFKIFGCNIHSINYSQLPSKFQDICHHKLSNFVFSMLGHLAETWGSRAVTWEGARRCGAPAGRSLDLTSKPIAVPQILFEVTVKERILKYLLWLEKQHWERSGVTLMCHMSPPESIFCPSWVFSVSVALEKMNNLVLVFPCRFQRLDYVYLNAGIMPNPQLNIKALFSGLFSR